MKYSPVWEEQVNYLHLNILSVIPDILTVGKAFGGGMPIGGLVTSQKLMSLFNNNPTLGHITTFGGHPLFMCRSFSKY